MENNEPVKDYFKVNRLLLKSDRWLSEKFTRGQAWVDLFGLAQHKKESFFRIRGIKVNLKRGQLGYSQLTLAKRWKWSVGKVKRFLNELEMDGDIEQQNNTVTTLITVIKYNLWQGDGVTNELTNEHQTNIKRETYNKENKENKDNNIAETSSAEFSSKEDYNKIIEKTKPQANITVGKKRHYPSANNDTTRRQSFPNKDTHTKDTHIKDIAETSSAEFSSKDYVESLLKDKKRHLNIIGKYFIACNILFPSLKAGQDEIRRWVKDASILAEYTDEQITKSYNYVVKEFPEQWNLSTIKKYINKHN